MNYIRNEQGNATFYMIWLIGIVGLIFVLVINLVKVYVVKEHANLSVEQAAIAGTAELLKLTEQAIDSIDNDPLIIAERLLTGEEKLSKQIKDKQDSYIYNQNLDPSTAYIKSVNQIIPAKMNDNAVFEYIIKQKFKSRLGSSIWALQTKVRPTVQDMISSNGGNISDTEIEFSTSKWRLEIKSTVTFESIADHKIINSFVKDIPQRGYGPSLDFLKDIY
ncbi:hypothetical protein [Bacillus sp. PS06]|uniref:hypothetical protein n=1 Tax=Bacillus sp. PS06 TaxID=2764176 RepID=UPI00177D455A|nr:hypothetical protein [Bacillus sp. PS06]MBD8071137.1 hypothetical protein [Bacillus sp. PS06]